MSGKTFSIITCQPAAGKLLKSCKDEESLLGWTLSWSHYFFV